MPFTENVLGEPCPYHKSKPHRLPFLVFRVKSLCYKNQRLILIQGGNGAQGKKHGAKKQKAPRFSIALHPIPRTTVGRC
jgi:hypothetical protein